MKVTLNQLIESEGAIVRLLENPLRNKLSDETNVKFHKIIDKINIPLAECRDKLNELVKKMGEEQEDGTYAIVDQDEYKKKRDALLNKKINIDQDVFDLGEFVTSIILADDIRVLQKWMINA